MVDEVSEFMVAGTVGLLSWFFGGIDGYIKVLVTFAIIDYITGVCAAGAEGKINVHVCRHSTCNRPACTRAVRIFRRYTDGCVSILRRQRRHKHSRER